MATIQDIANEVGISKAAVSRILNRKGSFNNETIEKVFQAAKRLHYNIPGENNFYDKDFKIIAAVFPLINIPYYSILASLLEQAAYKYGYSLMICNSVYNREKEEVFINHLREKKINGLIYGSFTSGVTIHEKENLPIVTVGYKISEHIPVVRSDNYSAGVIAARHLLSKNCKNYIYISGYQDSEGKDERYVGFKDELTKNKGIQLNAYFTGINEKMKDIPSVVTQMLLEHPESDAIFAESYSLAIQCLKTCGDLGIKVPEQVKIVGYGNSLLAQYSFPKISFIKENTKQIAELVVSTLVDIIEKDSEDSMTNINGLENIVPVSFEQNQTT